MHGKMSAMKKKNKYNPMKSQAQARKANTEHKRLDIQYESNENASTNVLLRNVTDEIGMGTLFTMTLPKRMSFYVKHELIASDYELSHWICHKHF